jgi:hypothetical protein
MAAGPVCRFAMNNFNMACRRKSCHTTMSKTIFILCVCACVCGALSSITPCSSCDYELTCIDTFQCKVTNKGDRGLSLSRFVMLNIIKKPKEIMRPLSITLDLSRLVQIEIEIEIVYIM